MIIDNSKLSFHDVMAAAHLQQSSTGIEPRRVKTSHLIIGGVVVLTIFGIGYCVGRQQMMKLSLRNYSPVYSSAEDKELKPEL